MITPNLTARASVTWTTCIVAVPFLYPGLNLIVDSVQLFFNLKDSDRGSIVGFIGVIGSLIFMWRLDRRREKQDNEMHEERRRDNIKSERMKSLRNNVVFAAKNARRFGVDDGFSVEVTEYGKFCVVVAWTTQYKSKHILPVSWRPWNQTANASSDDCVFNMFTRVFHSSENYEEIMNKNYNGTLITRFDWDYHVKISRISGKYSKEVIQLIMTDRKNLDDTEHMKDPHYTLSARAIARVHFYDFLKMEQCKKDSEKFKVRDWVSEGFISEDSDVSRIGFSQTQKPLTVHYPVGEDMQTGCMVCIGLDRDGNARFEFVDENSDLNKQVLYALDHHPDSRDRGNMTATIKKGEMAEGICAYIGCETEILVQEAENGRLRIIPITGKRDNAAS